MACQLGFMGMGLGRSSRDRAIVTARPFSPRPTMGSHCGHGNRATGRLTISALCPRRRWRRSHQPAPCHRPFAGTKNGKWKMENGKFR